MTVGGKKGQPYPSNTRIHRKLSGSFAELAAVTFGTPVSIIIPIAGDNYTRLYFKATKAGTLKFEFERPHPEIGVYDSKPVPDVVTVADIEKVVTVPIEGEAKLKVTFTIDVTGVITYADVAHNWGI